MTGPCSGTLVDDETRRLAKVLWDYHCLDLGLRPADFVLALGSQDERVAAHAAQLVIDGFAPYLVAAGGFGKVTRELWHVPEGQRFADIARRLGVPDDRVLVETSSTNTGENIVKTRELLAQQARRVRTGILVTKPYMRRRAYATAAKQWPEVSWLVTSPNVTFEDYPSPDIPATRMIELMVGDLQRIAEYPAQGLQAPQDIPADVHQAYEELVRRGFDKYLLSPSP
jgi:uncharacterized SAM-binding protein YcdF (DUF218 family)